ncbi:ABC-three component system middle component 8 [Lacipirellula parvula]
MLLLRLKEKRLVGYESLREHAQKSVRGGETLFLPAVNFLYLMGMIEYRPKTDSFEYVGLNATI